MIGFVGLCLLAGAVGGTIAASAIHTWYPSLTPPPGTPPTWVFAPVWTTLYATMGVSGWLVWCRRGRGRALRLWGWQLAASALWAPAFFGLYSPRIAMAVILASLVLLGMTIRAFLRLDRGAAWLLLPCLGWSLYAAYLNAGFWWLNPV